jgi:histone deacetylase complex regulatory component SIN3
LSNGYYDALLNIIDHFFEGEMESSSFEENVRYVFGINAYMMFTVDKLVQALIKQVTFITIEHTTVFLICSMSDSTNHCRQKVQGINQAILQKSNHPQEYPGVSI